MLRPNSQIESGGTMRTRVVAVAVLLGVAIAGCGGSGGGVSSASLKHRLFPASGVPGFRLQRVLDWSDPVNLVGEGLALPQTTRPSEGVKEFKDAHLRGATGEILTSGEAPSETQITVGVAQFASAADANRVRDWMHSQDLQQPCYGKCIFSPAPVSLAGVPSARVVVQSAKVPPPPPGAPRGVRIGPAPANYLAEFTIGPNLYLAVLHADSTAQSRFELGVKAYYAHAREEA